VLLLWLTSNLLPHILILPFLRHGFSFACLQGAVKKTNLGALNSNAAPAAAAAAPAAAAAAGDADVFVDGGSKHANGIDQAGKLLNRSAAAAAVKVAAHAENGAARVRGDDDVQTDGESLTMNGAAIAV
jgi:hypothetical protein